MKWKWVVQWLDETQSVVRARAFDVGDEAIDFSAEMRTKGFVVLGPPMAARCELNEAAQMLEIERERLAAIGRSYADEIKAEDEERKQ